MNGESVTRTVWLEVTHDQWTGYLRSQASTEAAAWTLVIFAGVALVFAITYTAFRHRAIERKGAGL